MDEPVAPHPDLWEMVPILAVLQRRGLCTRQDLADVIEKVPRTNNHHSLPTGLRKPYLATNSNNPVLNNVLTMLHKNGMVPSQGDRFLSRVRQIIAQSERVVRKLLR
jgi:hypothetical protein